jgi:hypothetical protein
MTGRWMLRALRWTALAAVAPALWACNARSLDKPTLKDDRTITKSFAQAINRNVDLLFMVDNSSSMHLSQTNLVNNFPTFMKRLADPPGLPNIHVAVVSSDMGAGYGDIDSCSPSGGLANPGGNQGIFQHTNRAPPGTDCAANALQPGANFISNIAGQANYTGNLADVFTCIAALGENGCGFEHQFASVLRALGADGRDPPAENQGFLRPDAYLVVVFITNEDDCSSAVEPQFFDIASNWNQASQLGESFRCNEFGHLCRAGGTATPMHPDRNAPGNDVTATVSYDSCTSDDASGYLLGVKDTADRLKKLKGDNPDMVLVAAITGPTAPYVVHWKNPSQTDTSCGAASCPWPEISHSCMAADSSYADPAIRVSELVGEFSSGLVLSICDDSFAPALDQIATLINKSLTPPCITQAIANKPGTSEPDCTITSHTSNGAGGTIDALVPACSSNGGVAPCWQLKAGTCPDGTSGQTVMVSADPNVTTSTAQNATVSCSLAPS